MGPFANRSAAARSAEEDAQDRRLAAARDAFPGWRIVETFGGFLAVPASAELVQAIDLDGLVMKLRDPGSWSR
jgi:hypothetical protein